MWTCEKCGERIEDQFDSCWRCSSTKGNPKPETPSQPGEKQWRMAYRVFRGTLSTWDELFSQAAEFATDLGPERVLSISHSADHHDGVVSVWYWEADVESAST